jgi:hypothetical protein
MWYSKISKDISLLPDAIDYYNNELQDARKDARIA